MWHIHFIMLTATTPKRLMKHAKLSWSFLLVTVEVIKTLMKENREEMEKWGGGVEQRNSVEICSVKYMVLGHGCTVHL